MTVMLNKFVSVHLSIGPKHPKKTKRKH